MIRIFHTADLHLGLKFTRGGYSPALRNRLVEQRLAALRGMVELANERSCEVFVMAGDLFDTPRVTKGIVREAAEILARFEGWQFSREITTMFRRRIRSGLRLWMHWGNGIIFCNGIRPVICGIRECRS
jgi:DNA repair exonuclease SbcCD nuclease subunit